MPRRKPTVCLAPNRSLRTSRDHSRIRTMLPPEINGNRMLADILPFRYSTNRLTSPFAPPHKRASHHPLASTKGIFRRSRGTRIGIPSNSTALMASATIINRFAPPCGCAICSAFWITEHIPFPMNAIVTEKTQRHVTFRASVSFS